MLKSPREQQVAALLLPTVQGVSFRLSMAFLGLSLPVHRETDKAQTAGGPALPQSLLQEVTVVGFKPLPG